LRGGVLLCRWPWRISSFPVGVKRTQCMKRLRIKFFNCVVGGR
jgi:hypothetical protein